MRYLKTYESYYSEEEFFSAVTSGLGEYNLRPVQIKHIIDQYSDEISQFCADGKDPKAFLDRIVKDMDIENGGGFLGVYAPANGSPAIKYL